MGQQAFIENHKSYCVLSKISIYKAMILFQSGLKKNTRRDRNMAKALVEAQEAMNQLILSLDSEQQEIKKQLIDFSERMVVIWDV